MTTSVSTLIVDDEPLARRGIRRLIEKHPGFRVAGECSDGIEAVEAIRRSNPDLVILDVQMPGLDGFGVLSELSPGRLPLVIFATAHDRYALEAFRVHAVDYVLKPIDPGQFNLALDRVMLILSSNQMRLAGEKVLGLLNSIGRQAGEKRDRIAVKVDDRVVLLRPKEIHWVEAAGDYVALHVRGEKYLIRETLTAFLERLDERIFVRIHRSVIVNLDHVRELRPLFRGELAVCLSDGTRLVASRTYRKNLDSSLR